MRVSASYAMLLHFIAVSVVSRCSCDVSHVASSESRLAVIFSAFPHAAATVRSKMSLEATMIVLDNSANSLNGDFPRAFWKTRPCRRRRLSSLTHTLGFSPPCCATASRLQAQSDSVFRIFGAKCRAHPENEVGLMVMGGKGSVVHFHSICRTGEPDRTLPLL
jgi:hypothetical protein